MAMLGVFHEDALNTHLSLVCGMNNEILEFGTDRGAAVLSMNAKYRIGGLRPNLRDYN